MEENKLPPPERAAKTAIGAGSSGKGTVGTYLKADALFSKKTGTKLDYGSGRGEGAKLIKADTYEPFVKSKPKYNDVKKIPSKSYNKITSLNVLNVLPPVARQAALKNIGRILKSNGEAIISTRGVKDVESAKNKVKIKDGYIIGKGDDARFQKGFTSTELKNYAQKVLGKNFTVENVKGIGKAGIKIKKLNVPKGLGGITRQDGAPIINIQERLLVNPKKNFSQGGDSKMDEDITKGQEPKYNFSDENLVNLPPQILENFLAKKYGVDRYMRERSSVFDDSSRNEITDRESILTGPELEALSINFENQIKKAKGMKKGGMPQQMELFQEGGLKDEGGTIDPVSGNDVPSGSTQEEVRDDIPAQLSEGEFVFPADVVRYIGLEKLMMIRQRAKAGLQRMEEMGQMGNSEEAILPDDMPFSIEDLDMEDDPIEMEVGGVVTTNPNTGNPTNMMGGVTSTVTGNPVNTSVYNPNVNQMYTPGGVTPYAPATYKSLLPESSSGQVKTENRKYVKGSSIRFVPFIVGTGQPLNPGQLAQLEADGYTPDTASTIKADPSKTKVESTKVKPVEQDSGDDGGPAPSSTLSLGGEKVGKGVRGTFRTSGATTFNTSFNIPGATGAGDLFKPFGFVKAITQGIYGGLTDKYPKGTTVKMGTGDISKVIGIDKYLSMKKDTTGQEAKNFVSYMNDLRNLNTNVIRPSVAREDKGILKDYSNKPEGIAVSYERIQEFGKDIADRLAEKDYNASILGIDVSANAVDEYNKLSEGEKSVYNDYVTEQQEQEEGDKIGSITPKEGFKNISSIFEEDKEDEQQDYGTPSDQSFGESSGGLGEGSTTTGGYATAKGGFIKKPKPKVKKMKRGGLASR